MSVKMSWWDEAEAVDLRFPRSATLAGLWELVASAAAEGSLVDVGADPTSTVGRHQYSLRAARRAFGVTVIDEDPTGRHILVSPAFDRETDLEEADAVSSLVLRIAVAGSAIAARSFNYAIGNGYFTPDEVDGPLRWVDWLQYLSPSIAERVGRDRLMSSLAYDVRRCDSGGVWLRVTQLPYERYSRRTLAGHLGISLRGLRDWDPATRTWSARDWPT